ncbi:DUF3426 domain-containing protein [Pulveribacter sp.]|uniref:DUF3426 domain-containing protein n=1 Tax=Pulveribacter sp. TaxID=2678893 RepID=UPI0028999BC1|nr:DUF3426 domain-containing protein [Pulveribacter sp.]
MSQITRCPHCATAFRVVADQLRIGDGWVRCGQCKEVFDATEQLGPEEPAPLLADMPMDRLATPHAAPTRAAPPAEPSVWSSARAAPAPVQPSIQAPASAPVTVLAPQPAPAAAAPAPWQQLPPPPVPAFLLATPVPPAVQEESAANAPAPADEVQAPVASEPALSEELPQEIEEAPEALPEPAAQVLPLDEGPVADADEAEPPLAAPAEETVPSPPLRTYPAEDEDEEIPLGPEPEFVRIARRSAFWRQPAVRGLLALLVLALAALLAGQAALHYRDALSARYPQARVALQQLCARLGCMLQPPRDISAVVIDSSSFLKARGDASRYELQVALKNTAAHPVAMPLLELTLTDAQDQLLVRRVLRPEGELGAAPELAPAAVWSATAPVQLEGGTPVAGYRLLAFYP